MFELTTPFGTKSFVAELYVNITHFDHFCPLRDFKGNISQIERRVVGCKSPTLDDILEKAAYLNEIENDLEL